MANFVDLHHPLIGRHPVTLAELIERADQQAQAVLRATARLAAHRVTVSGQGTARWDTYASPYVEPSPRHLPHTLTAAICPTDLLRAIVALHPEELSDRLLQNSAIDRQFAQDSQRWRLGLAASGAAQLQHLDRRWANAWRYTLLRRPDTVVDVPLLVGSMPQRTYGRLPTWDRDHTLGAIGNKELLQRVVDSLWRSRTPVLLDVPPLYVNRHGGLEALDAVFEQSSLTFILGNADTGRSALLRAWCERLWTRGKPDFLGDRTGYVVGSLFGNVETLTSRLDRIEADGARWLFAFTENVPERLGGPGWDLGNHDLGRQTLNVLRRLFRAVAQSPERFHMMLTMGRHAYKNLCETFGDVATTPIIVVPALGRRDFFSVLLCVAASDTTCEERVGLAALLATVEERHQRGEWSWQHGRVSHTALLASARVLQRKARHREWQRRLEAAGDALVFPTSWAHTTCAFIEETLGDMEALVALRHLESQLP